MCGHAGPMDVLIRVYTEKLLNGTKDALYPRAFTELLPQNPCDGHYSSRSGPARVRHCWLLPALRPVITGAPSRSVARPSGALPLCKPWPHVAHFGV